MNKATQQLTAAATFLAPASAFAHADADVLGVVVHALLHWADSIAAVVALAIGAVLLTRKLIRTPREPRGKQ